MNIQSELAKLLPLQQDSKGWFLYHCLYPRFSAEDAASYNFLKVKKIKEILEGKGTGRNCPRCRRECSTY